MRLQLAALPGFVRVSCVNMTGGALRVSLAMGAPYFTLRSDVSPIALPAWGEHVVVVNYESHRAVALRVIALLDDNRDTLVSRASVRVPVAAPGILKGWAAWARAAAWVPLVPLAMDIDDAAISQVLECHGPLVPVGNLPPGYDAAWACPAIPALLAVGPARKDLFTPVLEFGQRCMNACRGGSASSRRALVQVGIAIAKIIDLIDINWELADILTALGDLGRLLPQAGVPASAVSPLVQLLAGVPGKKVEDLDKSVQAALSQGIGRLERLAASGGPANTQGEGRA